MFCSIAGAAALSRKRRCVPTPETCMLISNIIAALEEIAPPSFAAEWDNVGLLAGSREWSADKALLTIDLTTSVVHEAIDAGAKLIVSYHPPIFHPVKSIT